MSLAGHAADFNATEVVNENIFKEAGVIYGDNIKIENLDGPAVGLTNLSSSQKNFSLQSASGGSINLVGCNDVVSLQNKGTLNIGSNDTANVTISSSENTQDTKLLFAKYKDSSVIVLGKDIVISGESVSSNLSGVVAGESGFPIVGGTSVVLGDESTDSVKVNVASEGLRVYAVEAQNKSSVEINAKKIELVSTTTAIWNSSSEVWIGSDSTETLTIRGNGTGLAMSVDANAQNAPKTVLKGGVIQISGDGSGAISNSAGDLEIGSSTTSSIILSGAKGYALRSVEGSKSTLNAQKITLIGGDATGGSAVYNDASTVTVGSDDTQSVVIQATDFPDPDQKKVGAGLSSIKGGTTTVKGKDISIQSLDTGVYAEEGTTIVSATDKLDISGRQLGVRVQNNDENGEGNRASITLSAENISVESSSVGISATSRGLLDVNGNLEINAPTAIEARGNSTINVNTDASKGYKTVINGDVVYAVGSGTG